MRRAVVMRGDPATESPEGGIAREPLRVLIVDDYRATADITCSLMSAWGHNVRRAYDASSALALAAAFRPDVVLLDIKMPQMNGFELARQLRLQVQLRHCFMIAHTGCTDAESRRQSALAGIDLFLIKPVAPSILRALLIWEADYVFRSRQEAATECPASESSRSASGCDEHFGPTKLTTRIPIPS